MDGSFGLMQFRIVESRDKRNSYKKSSFRALDSFKIPTETIWSRQGE